MSQLADGFKKWVNLHNVAECLPPLISWLMFALMEFDSGESDGRAESDLFRKSRLPSSKVPP